jgi:hypothetical protein
LSEHITDLSSHFENDLFALVTPLYGLSCDSDELHLEKSISIVKYQSGSSLPLPDENVLSRFLTFQWRAALIIQRNDIPGL